MYIDTRFITSGSNPLVLCLEVDGDVCDVAFKYASNCSRPIAINLEKKSALI
jgi:hypothetical protein